MGAWLPRLGVLCLKQAGAVCGGVLLCFFALLGLPDAAYHRAGPFATQAVVQQFRSELMLDRPPHVRFVMYWKRLLTGELCSFYTREPLLSVLPLKAAVTAQVVGIGVVALLLLTSLWLAVLRLSPGTGGLLNLVVGTSASVPVFLTATFCLYVGTALGIPAIVGAGVSLAVYPSVLLATNLELRWRTMKRSVYYNLARHYRVPFGRMALRAVREFAPAAVLIGNALAFYLAIGASIVELLFGLPGLGRWMLESLLRLDLPVIFLTGTVVSVSASLILLAANAVGLLADPRHTPRWVVAA